MAAVLQFDFVLLRRDDSKESSELWQLCCCWSQVRVVLMKTEHMCSIAFKDRHAQEVKVAAGSSVAVPYTIVPLAVGKLPVEVMVVGRGLTGEDRIQKLLRVVVSSRAVRSAGRTEFNWKCDCTDFAIE